MSTSFKKNELIDLLTLLGLRASAKSVKAKLEADIVKHLADHPGDVRLDERLSEFIDKSANVDTTVVDSEVVDNDEEEETSAEEQLEEKLEEVAEQVEGAWAKIKTQHAKLHTRVRHGAANFRSSLSTVASVNWTLTIVEYAVLVFLTWPHTAFGLFNRDLKYVAEVLPKAVALYSALFILVPLAFSFVVNFTKKSAIRRKKHVYIVDPILYGLARFVAAALVLISGTPRVPRPAIAAVSGLTSALVGIYASILQTP